MSLLKVLIPLPPQTHMHKGATFLSQWVLREVQGTGTHTHVFTQPLLQYKGATLLSQWVFLLQEAQEQTHTHTSLPDHYSSQSKQETRGQILPVKTKQLPEGERKVVRFTRDEVIKINDLLILTVHLSYCSFLTFPPPPPSSLPLTFFPYTNHRYYLPLFPTPLSTCRPTHTHTLTHTNDTLSVSFLSLSLILFLNSVFSPSSSLPFSCVC